MKQAKRPIAPKPMIGQRVIFSLVQTRRGSAINSIDLVDSFDDWQLVDALPCSQAIIMPDRSQKMVLYQPKTGMCAQFKSVQMRNGIWPLTEGYVLPDNLCTALQMDIPGQIQPGRYRPIDLGGHLVFRLSWTTSEDVFLDY